MIQFNSKPLSRTPSERFERKFYLPSSTLPLARHLLKHCCPPDRHYHRGTIHSVYYDTAGMDYLDESEQGNCIRQKVRIRWYNQPQADQPAPVFVELKSKNGFAGSKQRKQMSVSGSQLVPTALQSGPLPYQQIVNTLTEFGYQPPNRLYPMILISYQRLRFVEMQTGTRVSLDWNIQSEPVCALAHSGQRALRMEGGVLEIKGQSSELPITLRSLGLLDTDWSRYSKYASSMQAHLEKPGSFGWLTPSGRGEVR